MKFFIMLLDATEWLLNHSCGVFKCIMFIVALCMVYSLDKQGALNHSIATTPVDVWIATSMICLLMWCSLTNEGK